eukprot:770741-Alexandrium_andersonii.AAC.1
MDSLLSAAMRWLELHLAQRIGILAAWKRWRSSRIGWAHVAVSDCHGPVGGWGRRAAEREAYQAAYGRLEPGQVH